MLVGGCTTPDALYQDSIGKTDVDIDKAPCVSGKTRLNMDEPENTAELAKKEIDSKESVAGTVDMVRATLLVP
jgi:hypothetical protein